MLNKVVSIKYLRNKDFIDENKKIVKYESKTELEDYALTDFAYVLLKDAINSAEYKEVTEEKDIDYYITYENIRYGMSENDKGAYIIKNIGEDNQTERIIEKKYYELLKDAVKTGRSRYYDIFKGIVVETSKRKDINKNEKKYVYVYRMTETTNKEYRWLNPMSYYEFSLEDIVIRDNNWNIITDLKEGDEVNFVIKKEKRATGIQPLGVTLPISCECISATVLGRDLGLIMEKDRKFTYESNEYLLSDYDYATLFYLKNWEISADDYTVCKINKEPNYICSLGGILIDENEVYLMNTTQNSSSENKKWSQSGEKITNREFATKIKEIFERSRN